MANAFLLIIASIFLSSYTISSDHLKKSNWGVNSPTKNVAIKQTTAKTEAKKQKNKETYKENIDDFIPSDQDTESKQKSKANPLPMNFADLLKPKQDAANTSQGNSEYEMTVDTTPNVKAGQDITFETEKTTSKSQQSDSSPNVEAVKQNVSNILEKLRGGN